ncbi:MAG: sensor histidine kinase [Candidatus Heimdallarchaeaceae archaeon]
MSIIPMIISLWDLESSLYMHTLSFLLPTVGGILGIITIFKAENKETRIFIITITFSFIMLLTFEFFDFFLNEDPSKLTANYWTFFHIAAYISFLGISIDRIIKDHKYITKASVFAGIAIVSLLTVVVSPILSYSYSKLGDTFSIFEFSLFAVFLAIELISFVILSILMVLYSRMKYGYHWLFIIVGFLIMLFRDLSRVYSMAISGGLQLLTPYVLNFIFYSTMITALIATYNPEFKIKSMRDIDMEREFYKQRYEEIEYLSKDLLTVTELWFHDLQNDLSVINNAMELYDETSKTSFLGIIKKRVGLMEERQKKFETPAHILDSLKIQPTNLNILDGIQRAFSGVDLILPVESVYVKANKLLFPIVLNVVQNAFQQNSDSVQVSITVEEMNSTVILKIIDDGIGVPDGMKDKIFLKNFQGNIGGTSGMGLYLAKLTLAKFGGRISVEDNEPSGAVFKIELERIISNNK